MYGSALLAATSLDGWWLLGIPLSNVLGQYAYGRAFRSRPTLIVAMPFLVACHVRADAIGGPGVFAAAIDQRSIGPVAPSSMKTLSVRLPPLREGTLAAP